MRMSSPSTRCGTGYPPEVTGHAERAATAMLAAVMNGTEPFGQVCRNWLAQAEP